MRGLSCRARAPTEASRRVGVAICRLSALMWVGIVFPDPGLRSGNVMVPPRSVMTSLRELIPFLFQYSPEQFQQSPPRFSHSEPVTALQFDQRQCRTYRCYYEKPDRRDEDDVSCAGIVCLVIQDDNRGDLPK